MDEFNLDNKNANLIKTFILKINDRDTKFQRNKINF